MLRLLLSILCTFLGGCIGGPSQPDPTRFYVLNALPETTSAQYATDSTFTLAIAPIMLPGYLDTERIASQTANNEIYYAEYYRWAEPLQKGLQSVITKSLSLLTGINAISTAPWSEANSKTLEICIIIYNFIQKANGVVQLDAQWRITEQSTKHTVIIGHNVYSQTPIAEGYDQLVAAMSNVTNQFVCDLARDISSVSKVCEQPLTFKESI